MWGCIGAVVGAFITAIAMLIVADKIPSPFAQSQIRPNPTTSIALVSTAAIASQSTIIAIPPTKTPLPIITTKPTNTPLPITIPASPTPDPTDRPTPTAKPLPTPAYVGEVIKKDGFSLILEDVKFFVLWPWGQGWGRGDDQLIEIRVKATNHSGRNVVTGFSSKNFNLTDNSSPPTQYQLLLPNFSAGGDNLSCSPVEFKGLWENGKILEIGCDPWCDNSNVAARPEYQIIALRFNAKQIPSNATSLMLYVEDFPYIGYASWTIPIPR